MNRYLLLFLNTASLVLLGFGWVMDMLHIEVNFSKEIFVQLDFNLFNENRSVLGTLKSLWESGNYLPFALIGLFGILVPLLKSVVIYYLLIVKSPKAGLYTFVNNISKWAMADVFVISIFVAFLGARAMESTKATLEPGFYFFAGYVLLSSLIAFLLGKLVKKPSGSIT